MKRFFNIQAGYDLVQRAVSAVYGELEGFDYFEDFVDHDTEAFTNRVRSPQRHTLLHLFLENLEVESLEADLHDVSPSENFAFLASYVRVAGVEPPPWFNEKEIDRHSEEAKTMFPQLAKAVVASSAFEILFNDREFLHRFQLNVTDALRRSDTPHPTNCYTAGGQVRRCARIPMWLKKAVFFRDRGRCQMCFKDVSGQLYVANEYHLDHVLSLAAFGTNDPTNFQLLCENCNLRKSVGRETPRNQQVRFWEMD